MTQNFRQRRCDHPMNRLELREGPIPWSARIVTAQGSNPHESRDRAVRFVDGSKKQDRELSLNAAVASVGQRMRVDVDIMRGSSTQPAADAGDRPRVVPLARTSITIPLLIPKTLSSCKSSHTPQPRNIVQR